MSLSSHCGDIFANSSMQNCCNSTTLEIFQAWTPCLRRCQSIAIWFKSMNWWTDILLQDFLLESRIHGSSSFSKSSWSSNAASDHYTTTDMFGAQTFHKVQLLSHRATEYFSKSLGGHQDANWQMWDEPVCLPLLGRFTTISHYLTRIYVN